MRGRIRNGFGTWEFELHEDGRADLMSFVPVKQPPSEDGILRGLGDVVAAATKAVGIQPCGPCKKRREALNRLVPFERKAPAAGVHPDAATGDERTGGAT